MNKMDRFINGGIRVLKKCGVDKRSKIMKNNIGYKKDFKMKDINNIKGNINENIRVIRGIMEDGIIDKDLDKYNKDATGKYMGKGKIVLKPKTTDEISKILEYCNIRNIKIIPQGGNTGLVGGCIAEENDIILNMERMNKIISLDEKTGIMICESGCILENLQNFANDKDFLMPLDMGSKGSCQIGGNIATNAGGIRYIRYKSLHANIIGLEAVLANGNIINTIKEIHKDNTGYHLAHLFIGSEGTLGIITKVAIQLYIKPKSINLLYIGVKDFSSVQEILSLSKYYLSEILSAFEYFDKSCLQTVINFLNLSDPLPSLHQYYIIIETHGSCIDHDHDKLQTFFELLLNKINSIDGILSNSIQDSVKIWNIRESIPESLKHTCPILLKYDISIAINFIPSLESFLIDTFPFVSPFFFGHLGDNNIHLNISLPFSFSSHISSISSSIYQWISNHKGSISAEHCIGISKKPYLHLSQSSANISLMKSIKNTLDPSNILNPRNIF